MNSNSERAGLLRTLGWTGVYLIVTLMLKACCQLFVPHGVEPANAQSIRELLQQVGPIGVLFFGAVMGPLIEEMIFRFGMYNVIRLCVAFVMRFFVSEDRAAAIGAWLAIVGSAFLFAAVHQETLVVNFISHFVMGIAAAHLYYRTERLSAPVMLHMSSNGIIFCFILFANG